MKEHESVVVYNIQIFLKAFFKSKYKKNLKNNTIVLLKVKSR